MSHPKPRLTWIVLIAFFFSLSVVAQNEEGESTKSARRLAEKLIAAETEAEQQALLLAEKEGVTSELVKALQAEGERLRFQGNYPQAIRHYQLAREIAERTGDKQGLALALNGFGAIHYLQGDYDRASDYYRRSLALGEASGDSAVIAKLLYNVGLVYRAQGNYDRAIELYRQALKLDEAAGKKDSIAHDLNSIGLVHRLRGDNRLALEYYQRALAKYEEAGNRTGVAGSLNNIGNIYRSQGNYLLALDYAQRVLTLAEMLGSQTLINYALSNIGTAHRSMGDYTRALEFYLKSLSIKEKLGDRAGIARTLNSIGQVYAAQSNYVSALEHHTKSLAIYEGLGEKAGTAEALVSIGRIYNLKGQNNSALPLLERAALLSLQIDRRDILWEARTLAGSVYRALNKFAQARQSFEEAIAAIEALRSQVAGGEQEQQRFFEDKLSPYHFIVELSIAENRIGEALAYAERAKARVLLDVLRSGRVNITKAMTLEEQERERRLNGEMISLNTQISRENQRSKIDDARLANLKSRLQRARLDHEIFQSGLYAAHPDLKAQRGETRPVTLEEIGALLPGTKTALLEYVVTEKQIFLFVATKSGRESSGGPLDLRVHTLNLTRNDLTARVEGFRKGVARRDLTAGASGRELYDLLLRPAREQLEGTESLIIVPDAALWELPFQALQDKRNRYLIEDHTVAYAVSLTVLREMTKARRGAPWGNGAAGEATLLAFGNPALGKEVTDRLRPALPERGLGPLPEAERQVKTLGQMYGAGRSRVYTGEEAREERLKAEAGKYRILQLATHGIFNDTSPMYSHVVLAQAQASDREDGLLEAWEMMNLNLSAALVVLSGCETARGRVGDGEGMIGLTWGLFVAGSPTTVVSQWKVESASTTTLMLDFHRSLQPHAGHAGSHVSTAGALRQAALRMLRGRDYRHPFYWAGFVVIGDNR